MAPRTDRVAGSAAERRYCSSGRYSLTAARRVRRLAPWTESVGYCQATVRVVKVPLVSASSFGAFLGQKTMRSVRTVYPIQTGGFHQAPGGAGKIVPEHGARRDGGEHLARLDPADGEDHSQVRVLLLEVHQRAKAP